MEWVLHPHDAGRKELSGNHGRQASRQTRELGRLITPISGFCTDFRGQILLCAHWSHQHGE